MTKTLRQRMAEWEAKERPKVEARYKQAAAQADNLEEIERLVDQIELQESNSRLVQLGKTLELVDSQLAELRHLALQKLADLKASGDLRVAETLKAFIDIIHAHEEGIGIAQGYMASAFKQAQLDHLAECEEVLCRPPIGDEVGRKLAETAALIGKAMRTRTDHNVAKAWAVLGKEEGWKRDD